MSIFTGSGAPGLDLTSAQIAGDTVLLQDAVKRVTAPEGSLWWDPTGTLDFRAELNNSNTPPERLALQAKIAGRFDDDPRYDTVSALLSFSAPAGPLVLNLTFTSTASRRTYQAAIQADGTYLVRRV